MLDSMQQADLTQISRRFRADFTPNSLQNAMRNLSGIHADSTHALSILDSNLLAAWNLVSILDSMQQADFTHISRRFHADFTQNSFQNARRNLSGIQAESMWNLPMPYPCLIPCSKQISRKFYADFTQHAMRNLSGILARSMRNLPMSYPCLIPCIKQISSLFYAEFLAEW